VVKEMDSALLYVAAGEPAGMFSRRPALTLSPVAAVTPWPASADAQT